MNGCDIHFAPPFRNPGMNEFFPKVDSVAKVLVSTMVTHFVRLRISDFVRPSVGFHGAVSDFVRPSTGIDEAR